MQVVFVPDGDQAFSPDAYLLRRVVHEQVNSRPLYAAEVRRRVTGAGPRVIDVEGLEAETSSFSRGGARRVTPFRGPLWPRRRVPRGETRAGRLPVAVGPVSGLR